MYGQESEVRAKERRSSLLQVCGAEGSPSDASFEIKFINVKYIADGIRRIGNGIMQQERLLPAATKHGKQNKKYK